MIKIMVMPPDAPRLPGFPTASETVYEFGAHKALLCHHSPCFADWLKDPEEKEIYLDDTFPKPFGTFILWLYYQDLGSQKWSPDFFDLCEVWLLADDFRVPELQNMVIDSLHKTTDDVPNEGALPGNLDSKLRLGERPCPEALRNFLFDIMVTTEESLVVEQICGYVDPKMIKDALIYKVARDCDKNVRSLGQASDYYVPVLDVQTDTESVGMEDIS